MKNTTTFLRLILTILLGLLGGCTVDARLVREGESFTVHIKPTPPPSDQKNAAIVAVPVGQ